MKLFCTPDGYFNALFATMYHCPGLGEPICQTSSPCHPLVIFLSSSIGLTHVHLCCLSYDTMA